MRQGSRALAMLAAGVVLLMAATLAADVVLSNSAIRAVGPPTATNGEVLRAEMTGYYPTAAAIRGIALSTGTAVYGSSSTGTGVSGASDTSFGVYGTSQNGHGGHFRSNGGFGVYAYATGTYFWDHGVYASANEGYAVYGNSSRSVGVYGQGPSYGVRGRGGNRGVYGSSAGEAGVYGYHDAWGDGVKGRSNSGTGVYGEAPGTNGIGVRGHTSGSNGYGGYFTSASYRGMYVRSDAGYYDAYFGGDLGIYVWGSIYAGGSKTGYVVDLARNDGPDPLQLGDVVVITGATDPVLGEIPVPTVRLADESASAGVMGVVDRMFATPADVGAIPEDVLQAWHELVTTSSTGAPPEGAAAGENGEVGNHEDLVEPRRPSMESPGRFVSQAEAEFLAKVKGAEPGIAPGAYLGVVTLGAFKAVRVDASYGAILPGDLLVSSPTPGHAMRAQDPLPGTVIGKTLGSLEEGQGAVPVLITLN